LSHLKRPSEEHWQKKRIKIKKQTSARHEGG